MAEIVRDDDVRSGDPRIAGTRITVLDVKRRVVDEDEDAGVVAGEYDLSMADVFYALAYYYENREAFQEREREAAAARREGERRTRDLFGDIRTDDRDASERAD